MLETNFRERKDSIISLAFSPPAFRIRSTTSQRILNKYGFHGKINFGVIERLDAFSKIINVSVRFHPQDGSQSWLRAFLFTLMENALLCTEKARKENELPFQIELVCFYCSSLHVPAFPFSAFVVPHAS